MGYQAGTDDPAPPARVELRSISRIDFELTTSFAYQPAQGPAIEVPTHPNTFASSTDLASVPPLLWGLLPSYGRQLRAALLHDRLCDLVNQEPDPQKAYEDRKRADNLFREAMRDKGDKSPTDLAKRVGWFRSWLFWTGVCYGRYWKFRKVRAALLSAHVLVGVLAIDLLFQLPLLSSLRQRLPWSLAQDNSALVLIWAGALILSLAWGTDDWKIPFIGLLVGPLILPVLLITFVAQLVLGLPDWLIHMIRPAEQPPGNFGPTATLAKLPGPAGPRPH